MGNYKDTQGKAYIGNHNFDFYSKNKISILHSNINDLIIIPHAYESDNRFISFCNSVSPVSKTKNVKLIFKNYQEEVLNSIPFASIKKDDVSIINLLRDQSEKKLFLEVSNTNTAAEKFYSSFDFSTVGIRRNYYKDGSDALLKEKNLTSN